MQSQNPFDPPRNPRDSDQKKALSGLGMFSCVLAALVWIGSCGGVVAIHQNQLYFFKNKSGMLAAQVGFYIILGMSLLGVGLAIGGLRQADRQKVFAVLGLIFNGLVLLGVFVVFCWALLNR